MTRREEQHVKDQGGAERRKEGREDVREEEGEGIFLYN